MTQNGLEQCGVYLGRGKVGSEGGGHNVSELGWLRSRVCSWEMRFYSSSVVLLAKMRNGNCEGCPKFVLSGDAREIRVEKFESKWLKDRFLT